MSLLGVHRQHPVYDVQGAVVRRSAYGCRLACLYLAAQLVVVFTVERDPVAFGCSAFGVACDDLIFGHVTSSGHIAGRYAEIMLSMFL